MLRVLIVSGLLLMVAGFGAAGLQYWQSQQLPDRPAGVSEPANRGPQTWLTSSSGGLVAEEDARAYLMQDRLVRSRTVTVTRTARLSDLLGDGEKLPEPPYFQVLADIRAPRIAEAMCPLVADSLAEICRVNAARVVAGSVDPVLGTARFSIELVYRQKPEAEPLPDLSAHVLEIRQIPLDLSGDPEASVTAEAALAAALRGARAVCTENDGIGCRLLGLTLDWDPGRNAQADARIGWLVPLPQGMFPAPPLEEAPVEG